MGYGHLIRRDRKDDTREITKKGIVELMNIIPPEIWIVLAIIAVFLIIITALAIIDAIKAFVDRNKDV